MLKEYLRQNQAFRKAWSPFAKIRASCNFAGTSRSRDTYRRVVCGGTIQVTPGNIPGSFSISATSDAAARVIVSGQYEPDVTAVLSRLRLKEGLIVNVGANVGFFAVFFARKFQEHKKVMAIEPNPDAFRMLEENIARNKLEERVRPIQVCIGDKGGEIAFSIIDGKPEYSSIGHIVHPSVAGLPQKRINVPVVRLRDALKTDEPVALLFVDTEGAEELVFAGARDILVRDHPILYFECCHPLLVKFGSSSNHLEEMLVKEGYVVRNGLAPRLPLRHPFNGEAIAIHESEFGGSGPWR